MTFCSTILGYGLTNEENKSINYMKLKYLKIILKVSSKQIKHISKTIISLTTLF